MSSVLLKTIRDQKRSLFWWSTGFFGLTLFIMLYWPTIEQNAAELSRYAETMPEAMKAMFGASSPGMAIATPAGYLTMELFSFMAPLLILIYAIGFGANAIAGEEERGTLDLLLANPITRRRFLLEKFAALIAGVGGLSLVFWLTLVGGAAIVDMDIGLARLTQATVSLALLGLSFGGIALAIGSATGKKGLSTGVTSGAGVVFYLINSFAPLVEGLDSLRKVSLFYYYTGNDPLVNGLKAGHVAVLVGVIVAMFVAGIFFFDKRDLAS
ncbi:MAG: ABC transporter permease [Candidatus Aquicultorales bacterium]